MAVGLKDSLFQRLSDIYSSSRVSAQPDELAVASKDESANAPVLPVAVVWPLNAEEILRTVRLCIETRTPITARGAGSALEGSAIPLSNGIVMDVSRMSSIRNYWPEDLQVEIEPGIVYDKLNDYLKRDALFFPPSPGGSGDFATVGGMVSTNASGIYSVKYGGTRDYVLSLDVVTGYGEQVKLGNRAVKRSSGYNLVELMCGSEGTLGIITSIVLKLAGLPEGRLQKAYKFPTERAAAQAVSEMRRYGVDVAAIEFLDKRVIGALNKLKSYGIEEVPMLLLEFHGHPSLLQSSSESAEAICSEQLGLPFQLPEGQQPWEIRHWVTESIKQLLPGYSIIRNDIAFPISRLPDMVTFCYTIGEKHYTPIFTFGHVGNGILHALMLARKHDSGEWNRAVRANIEIVEEAVRIGGTVSGEHGIGLGLKLQFLKEHGNAVELMRQIKKQFDPHNILNPGKIFDIA
ncbi:MAG: FAD-binding oxidoreductase [candidate division Zixibacteria bacterium]|nr:FAD-binding oxidoreductase [candidate division Zixibacteria bacterium]